MGSIQPSGSINPSSSNKEINFRNYNNSEFEVKIEELTEEEGKDILKDVLRLRVPFFDNTTLQILSNITYITGNGPFHEGLIFISKKGLYYIAQTYPVTFISVQSLDEAVKEVQVKKYNADIELNLQKRLVATELRNFKAKKDSAIEPLCEEFMKQKKEGISPEELKVIADNILFEIKNGPPFVYS